MIIRFSKHKALVFDRQYFTLSSIHVVLLSKSTNIFSLLLKIIEKYLKETSGDYHKPKIVNVWEVDRVMEVGTIVNLVRFYTED